MQRLSSSLFCASHRTLPCLTLSGSHCLHVSSRPKAVALPITATGPPPAAPISATSELIVRRQRRAELLKHGKSLRADQSSPENRLKKRFWKDVNVKTDSGMFSLSKTNNPPSPSLLLSNRYTQIQTPCSNHHL